MTSPVELSAPLIDETCQALTWCVETLFGGAVSVNALSDDQVQKIAQIERLISELSHSMPAETKAADIAPSGNGDAGSSLVKCMDFTLSNGRIFRATRLL